MRFRLRDILLASILPLSAGHASQGPSGTVTIPIEEFLQLQDSRRAPDVTTVEAVAFGGDYGKLLNVTISGNSSGTPKAVPFLQRSEAFGLKNCTGSNSILSGNESHLSLVPLRAGAFRLQCQIQLRNWSQVEFNVDNALHVGAQVSGAEALTRSAGLTQVLTLVRPSAPVDDSKAPLAVVARYRVTVQPEESRFSYEFQISNPNRVVRRLQIPKLNGEIFSAIRTTIQHQEGEQALSLDLRPGENTVGIDGRFPGRAFQPLLEGQSFVLIENNPSLQLSLESPGRRVSPNDAGIPPRFAGARAYLISADQKVTWESRKLEVFSALGFAVQSASYLYYLPRQGQPIVEATFEINNQGTPEMPLKVPGQVTYLEVAGEPQVLSRDKDNNLVFQLPTGRQRVLVQYLSQAGHGSIVAVPNDELVRPETAMSNVSVTLRSDRSWSLAFGRSVFEIESDLKTATLFWALGLSLLTFWLALRAGLSRHSSLALSSAVFAGLVLAPWILVWMVILLLVYLAVRHRAFLLGQMPTSRPLIFVAGGMGLLAVFMLYLVREATFSKDATGHMSGRTSTEQLYEDAEVMAESVAAPRSAKMADADSAGGLSADDYQGVPARLEIPAGQTVIFQQGLLDAKTPAKVSAVMFSRGLGELGLIVSLLVSLAIVFRNRRRFAADLGWP